MVSYTDISPIKQPDIPVAVDLNEPAKQFMTDEQSAHERERGSDDGGGKALQFSAWLKSWELMESKALYFWGVTEESLPQLQMLFKACKGSRLNVDPHESVYIAGNVEFRTVQDTEKAFVVLNRMRLAGNSGTLYMSPIAIGTELLAPPDRASRGGRNGANSGCYVCVKHIPEEADLFTLYDFLRPIGPLYYCNIPTHPSGSKKDFAVAGFIDPQDAALAIEQLNYNEYLGNNVVVQQAHQPRTLRHNPHYSQQAEDYQIQSPHYSATRPQPPVSASAPRAPFAPAVSAQPPTTPPPSQSPSLPSPTQHRPTTPIARPCSTSSSVTAGNRARAATPPPASGTDSSTGGNLGPGNGLGGVIVPGKLFITNLHPTVSHKELFALFKTYGFIQSARVSIDPTTNKSRGHGIVQFSDPNSALMALRECQGADIKGRRITLYQYEHVNRNGNNGAAGHHHRVGATSSSSGGGPAHASAGSPTSSAGYSNTQAYPMAGALSPTRREGQLEHHGYCHRGAASNGHSATHGTETDPLLDISVLGKLTETARNEILTQKLISEVAANPAVDVRDSSKIVDEILACDIEQTIEMLRSPELLAAEWEAARGRVAEKERKHSGAESKGGAQQDTASYLGYQQHDPASSLLPEPSAGAQALLDSMSSETHQDRYFDEASSPESRAAAGGIKLQGYDTETEVYIETLMACTDNERKKKLGSRLFPLIKGMGYKESTKLTVWILDHMSQDIRSLAYTINDSAKLRDVVNEAHRAISSK